MEAWARALRATILVALVAAFAWFVGTAGRPEPRADLARASAWVAGARDADAIVARRADEPARVVDRRPTPSSDLGEARAHLWPSPRPPTVEDATCVLEAVVAPPPAYRSVEAGGATAARRRPPVRGPPSRG